MKEDENLFPPQDHSSDEKTQERENFTSGEKEPGDPTGNDNGRPEKKKRWGIALGAVLGICFLAIIGFFMSRIFLTEMPALSEDMYAFEESPEASDDKSASGTAGLKDEAGEESEQGIDEKEEPVSETENSDSKDQDIETADGKVNIITSDVSGMVKEVMPGIVSITNSEIVQYYDWFGQSYSYELPSAGSGIIIRQEGNALYIATNYHVVESASEISVGFIDDTTAEAQIQGTCEEKDLAVIRINLSDLEEETLSKIKIASIGDSSVLKVGEAAVAIGNAMGYGQSVTMGVISALDRTISVEGSEYHVIQTDAAINPGNSGGALLNGKGEVIGINSVKLASSSIEGMGYSIPMEIAKPIIEELIEKEAEVTEQKESGYLGIAGLDIDEAAAEQYGMPQGVYIAQVYAGTAAEKSGLKKGDIIYSINGEEMDGMAELKEIIEEFQPGDVIKLGVRIYINGNYENQIVKVTLGSKTDSAENPQYGDPSDAENGTVFY